MLEHRGSHGTGVVDNTLYVFGGGGMKSNLASNEKLDMTDTGVKDVDADAQCRGGSANSAGGKWVPVVSMPTTRHALVVVSHKTSCYAIGK